MWTVILTSCAWLGFSAGEVCGRYYQGDGLGVNLVLDILPNGRFRFAWNGCLGEYDKNAGRWELQGDRLVLKPERPHAIDGFRGMDVRFVPVKWGRRVMLVDENEAPAFAAQAGRWRSAPWDDERHPSEYTKVDAKFKTPPRTGRPVLPALYRKPYEKGDVQARIDRVEPDGTVVVAGPTDRLRPGLRLGARFYEVEMTAPDRGRVWYYWNSGEPPRKGDRLGLERRSTGFRRYASLAQIPRPRR